MLRSLMAERHTVRTLSFDYGQRHSKELEFAEKLSRLWDVPHETADLRGISHLLADNSLTSPAIPRARRALQ